MDRLTMLQVEADNGAEPSSPSRRLSMDPVSQHLRLEEMPNPGGRFEILDILGVGTCAKTYSALDKQKGNKVAVKIISDIAEHLLEIESEYRVLSSMAGKSLLLPEFHGVYLHCTEEGKKQIWFVMELCEGVPISDLLKYYRLAGHVLKEEEISILMKTFIMAVLQLHENDVIHRDIRASNFILSREGNVKLIDFGSSALLKDTEGKAQSSVGAPFWMAPEVIASEQMMPYTKSCDIWSLGITAIELADTEPPLYSLHPVRAMFQIARNPPPLLRRAINWSEHFKDFINECLVKNPDHRPCAVELLLHPFISEVEENMIQTMTLEEHLQNPICPVIGEKGMQILKNLGLVVETNLYPLKPYTPCTVTVKNGYMKKECDLQYVKMCSDDLAGTDNPTEESVLDLLKNRYMANSVYTYVGDILLKINPFKELPHYLPEVQLCYSEKARSDNPPHIYAIADRAYQQMLHHKRSQVILLFGVSASGKSYSANRLINHLSFLGKGRNEGMSEKMNHLCPLLDAFGSASTDKNPESSRFLKTITVTFTKTGKITGAIISSVLLEVIRISRNETNFHVFYYVYEGLKSENLLGEFGLDKMSKFRYLPHLSQKSKTDLIEGYKVVQNAFRVLAFTEEEIQTVLRMIASILLLGDITFTKNGSSFAVESKEIVHLVATNLSLDIEKVKAILSRGSSLKEADIHRDKFAQFLYLKIFDWVVSIMNKQLSFSRLVLGNSFSVSVIDPPGLENNGTQNNGLFQLCANTISDFLQNYIQQLMFYKELDEYSEEDVAIPFHFKETVPKTQLIQSLLDNGGLFAAVDKLSSAGRNGNCDLSALQDVEKEDCVTVLNDQVTVKHISDTVTYNAKRLAEHNVQFNEGNFVAVLKNSSNPIVGTMGTRNARFFFSSSDSNPSDKSVSLSEELRCLLPGVLHLFTEDFPHLVVCIKPSLSNLGQKFEHQDVTQQLRSFYLMEIVLIRKQGFARRLSFEEFMNRYKYLAFDFDEEVDVTMENCKLLLIRLKMDGWVMGKNKVFLKYYTEEYLSRLYETHVKKIIKVQAMARRFIVKVRRKHV